MDQIAAALRLPRAAVAVQHDALVDLVVEHGAEGCVRHGEYVGAQLPHRLLLVQLDILGVVVNGQELVGVDGDQDVSGVRVDLESVETLAQSLQNALFPHRLEAAEVVVIVDAALVSAGSAVSLLQDEVVALSLGVPPLGFRWPKQDPFQKAVVRLQRPLLLAALPHLQEAVLPTDVQAQGDQGIADDGPGRVPAADLHWAVSSRALGHPGVDLNDAGFQILVRDPGSICSAHSDFQAGFSIPQYLQHPLK